MDEENKKLRKAEQREFHDSGALAAVEARQALAKRRSGRVEKRRGGSAEAAPGGEEGQSARGGAVPSRGLDDAGRDGPQWLRDEVAPPRRKARREARKQDLFCPVCAKLQECETWEATERSSTKPQCSS